MDRERIIIETLKCRMSPAYFISTYCSLKDEGARDWRPFQLWPSQQQVLQEIDEHRLVAMLKARQTGMSWLVIAYCLHQALLHPAQTILLFSKRDDEAMDLLTNRFKAMHARLPDWLRARRLNRDTEHEIELSNGSRLRAFPSQGGDSYTASLVVLDEFDLLHDQDRLLASVKPTIDAAGRLIILSRPDKSRPETPMKRLWRAADSPYHKIFMPWHARPDRDAAWYEAIKQEIVTRTGALDDLHQSYPATPEEALAPRSLDKRLPSQWLLQCFMPLDPAPFALGAPALPQLHIYRAPIRGRAYCLGGDPALGNPLSDDSSITVLDIDTGEEVAALAAKVEPGVFAAYIAQICDYYNGAGALVERNNHGHAVLLALKELYPGVRVLCDYFDEKPGWNTTSKSKALLYSTAAEAFRDQQTLTHDRKTYLQLASVEASTLKAPEGLHDDAAMSYVLALQARALPGNVVSVVTITRAEEEAKFDPLGIQWPSENRDDAW